MTKDELIKQIQENFKLNETTIEINQCLPYIAIERVDWDIYFMQEHEAQEFLDNEVDPIIKYCDNQVSEQEVIAYISRDW